MMKEHRAYGFIPLNMCAHGWMVLLVQHKNFWAFPKGHAEPGETPLESATRELLEETGLCPTNFLSEETLKELYFFKHEGILIRKEVEYFIAEVTGKLVIQEDEISDAQWIALEKAEDLATYKEAKNICKKVVELLSKSK